MKQWVKINASQAIYYCLMLDYKYPIMHNSIEDFAELKKNSTKQYKA